MPTPNSHPHRARLQTRARTQTRTTGTTNATSALAPADLADLYLDLSSRLEQIVRLDVRAPEVVIEDACQFAWSRLVLHRERVSREGVLSWLVQTAIHEAYKLLRRAGRERRLDELPGVAATPEPEQVLDCKERLGSLGMLPVRQQRLLWLHGAGLSYAEIAVYERCTRRTVERQLLRAKRAVRTAPTD